MWHSHDGILAGDGVFGALIVKDPDDPHYNKYSHDCTNNPDGSGDCVHNAQFFDW